jgi:oxaloacetate decarboxylase alpha subunit
MHGSGAFEKLPHAVMRLLIERVVSYGIALTRTSNCWNDFESLKEELHQLRKVGMETIVNLIYSVSPRHSDAYYAEKAREAASIRPYRICFKEWVAARRNVPAADSGIFQNAATSQGYHAHCNNGLAPSAISKR